MLKISLISRIHSSALRALILAAKLLFIATACEELPCANSEGVNVNAGFFTIDGTILREVQIDSLTVFLYNDTYAPFGKEYFQPLNKLAIPLSINNDTTTVVFKYKDGTADTLNFYYERSVVLISHQCGFETFFQLDTITSTQHKIESVWISKETIDYGKAENIKIYF
jgi:hypothetical protein